MTNFAKIAVLYLILLLLFTESQNDFTMLLKSDFPETRHLPNAIFGELLPQFHDLLMKRLAKKLVMLAIELNTIGFLIILKLNNTEVKK